MPSGLSVTLHKRKIAAFTVALTPLHAVTVTFLCFPLEDPAPFPLRATITKAKNQNPVWLKEINREQKSQFKIYTLMLHFTESPLN